MLEHGADVTAQAIVCDAPLHHASRSGYLEVARLLVEHGANIKAEGDMGKTAFQVASEKGHLDVAKFLTDHASKQENIL